RQRRDVLPLLEEAQAAIEALAGFGLDRGRRWRRRRRSGRRRRRLGGARGPRREPARLSEGGEERGREGEGDGGGGETRGHARPAYSNGLSVTRPVLAARSCAFLGILVAGAPGCAWGCDGGGGPTLSRRAADRGPRAGAGD